MKQDSVSGLGAGKTGIRFLAVKAEFSKDESIVQVSKSASKYRSWCK